MPLTSPGNDDDTGENHQPTLRKNTAEPVEQTLKQNTEGRSGGAHHEPAGGGVNSVVKDVLRNHRGLPEEHMRRACEWVCYMKTAHPRPESFIPDALRKGEKATTPEPDDSVAPAYGTGIDWNEFHTTTRYPNTTD